ncbi:MAG: hypothetical protein ACREHC_01525 [Candidatus Levyibacteriota bacterium]
MKEILKIFIKVGKWFFYLLLTIFIFIILGKLRHALFGVTLTGIIIQLIFDFIQISIIFALIYDGLRMILHGGRYRSIFPDIKEQLLTEILEETKKRKK